MQCEVFHESEKPGNRSCSGDAKYKVTYTCHINTIFMCSASAGFVRRIVDSGRECGCHLAIASESWIIERIPNGM